MQIVRDLAGYTLGRSDLLRRAMSKKKAAVMEKERQSFVYGNKEENVPGCISNGIDEATANHIYDSMIDFAKYAFNKSHAAAYAIVSYQTAWLKYHYPVEFMAALMTSVIDNPSKVAGYIYNCRQMGIDILPPDINKGEAKFSVENGSIRYALSAIKGIGKNVVDAIEAARNESGPFKSIRDFCSRLSSKEVNKRTIENFIKAGCFDGVGANRRQLMIVYSMVLDSVQQEKKNAISGQMSLFDFMSESDRAAFEIPLPDVPEYSKAELLSYEKEVLGIYVSGHPLDDYEKRWRKTISAISTDFIPEDETNMPKVKDGTRVIIGGIITEKTVKFTKQNKAMAFLTIEDLFGNIEVIVFPNSYENYLSILLDDAKIFAEGRISVEDDKPAKLILEKAWPLDESVRELWIQLEDMNEYKEKKETVLKLIRQNPGRSEVVLYLKKEKAIKRLSAGQRVNLDSAITEKLIELCGTDNVRVVEK